MSYKDFLFPGVVKHFGLTVSEQAGLYAAVTPTPPSSWLRETLAEGMPLASSINSEKARSEMLIAPVLIEVRRMLDRRIGLFSGVNFPVDAAQGLTGLCDFLLTRSPEQLYIKAPVLFVAEAKNEDITGGLGQCLAEMVAAQVFNSRETEDERSCPSSIYGVVSTGEIWRFLCISGRSVKIDLSSYHIGDVAQVLGILRAMLTGALPD